MSTVICCAALVAVTCAGSAGAGPPDPPEEIVPAPGETEQESVEPMPGPASPQICVDLYGFGDVPVAVAKAEGGEVLATVVWEFHPALGVCFLRLDRRSIGALRAWHASGVELHVDGPPEGRWIAVTAGGHESSHACAVNSEAAMACWGDDYAGQATAPVGRFRAVSAGGSHACAVAASGALVCWGDDTVGQTSPPEGVFSSVASGSIHSCAIRESDGGVECWGDNRNGQASPPGGTFSSIAAGGYHSCALRALDGVVECWGHNVHGQASPPPGGFSSLAAGDYLTCGLSSGRLACWGLAAADAPVGGRFAMVDLGDEHGCALDTDGRVVCWGDNRYGQASPPAGLYSEISAGEDATCAIETHGRVVCWGLL